MNRKNDLLNLGELYEAKFITESTDTIHKDTFPKAKDKTPKPAQTKPNAFYHDNSGPENADGFQDDAIDPAKKKYKKDPEVTKFSQKNESARINTFMSKKFDVLFNDVMNDRLQLEEMDIETIEDVAELPELDDEVDMGVYEGDDEDMTPGEMLDKVMDLLGKIRDSIDSGEGDEEDDLVDDEELDLDIDLGDEDEDEEHMAYGEETATETVSDSKGHGLTGKNNKVKSIFF